MRKAFKYKIYPTDTQREILGHQINEACRLYNAAVQERVEAWQIARKSVNWYEQKKQLKEIRAAGDTDIQNFQVGSDVLKRVDLAFQAFFRRVKKGQTPGFPRYRSRIFYDSITFTAWNNGCRFKGKKLYVQGVGNLKIRLHRPIDGKIKTLTIKREVDQWFAIFSVEYEAEPLAATSEAVGIDVGLKSFAALSTGETIENPRWYVEMEKELRVAQRKVARRKPKPGQKASRGYKEAKDEVRKIHRKIQNRRRNFQHHTSRQIVNRFDVIAVEDLNVKGMQMSRLAKSVSDAAWTGFMHCLEYKSEEAGREMIKVNPRGTSQTCICGAAVPKKLSERTHLCEACGAREDRDVMSAKVILQRAIK